MICRRFATSILLVLSCLPPLASSFATPRRKYRAPPSSLSTPFQKIRGGAEEGSVGGSSTALGSAGAIAGTLQAAIQSGPWGVLALAGVGSSVIVPLTMIRQGYAFSIAYGLSVLAMALTVIKSFGIGIGIGAGIADPTKLLAASVIFYGARLGLFLFFRQLTVPSKAKAMKALDKSPRLERIPLGLSVALFYAFQVSPLMYAARNPPASPTNILAVGGALLAWMGALMEAIADAHKWIKYRTSSEEEGVFIGPTGGMYRLCRHPAYFAEVLFWFGLALAGTPSFGRSPLPWLCASSGFFGIYSIMTAATKRVEGRQKEKYGGQEAYEAYTRAVLPPIWPWAPGKSS